MGDPDWLVYDGVPPVTEAPTNQKFGPNGAINPAAEQVFIEINFKEATDYDNLTGLLGINENITFWSTKAKGNLGAGEGIAYNIYNVKSTFRGGAFKQTLTGVIFERKPIKEKESEASSARNSKPTPSSPPQSSPDSSFQTAPQSPNDDAVAASDVAVARSIAARNEAEAREAAVASTGPNATPADRANALTRLREAGAARIAVSEATRRQSRIGS